jgi:hypothetical protein
MKTDYIKLAQYLDKIGKYRQADNVEKYIRLAQYSAAPTYQSGGPKNPYSGYLDATAMGRQQAGFGAALQQGVGQESGIVGFLPLTPEQMKQMSPQDIFNYNTSLGEQLVQDARRYTGPNKFDQIINMINERLKAASPEQKSQIYQQSLETLISSELSNTVMNGTPENLNQCLNSLRKLGLSEVFSRTVPKAIQFALADMSLDPNPEVKKRYNDFVNDPAVKQLNLGFSPVQ